HLCFHSFAASLYTTCWKAKFQGKLNGMVSIRQRYPASRTSSSADMRHHPTHAQQSLPRKQNPDVVTRSHNSVCVFRDTTQGSKGSLVHLKTLALFPQSS
ncbi:hypothetical protein, partial [Burkholderia ubonensis]|uniref:hypothetical protein n=1 Tax=Burkholderia ubonensis TaxID=101571 RepID=UPI001E4541D6